MENGLSINLSFTFALFQMKPFLLIIKQFIFWNLFFLLNRLLFLFYHFKKLSGTSVLEILETFYRGFYLDISTSCYFLIIPFFLIFLSEISNQKIFIFFNRIYSVGIIAIVSIIVSSELGVYSEWGTKLNVKALLYLHQPSEIFRSATTGMIMSGFLFFILQVISGIYLYKKISVDDIKMGIRAPANKIVLFFYFLFIPGFIFLGMRGGWQPIPIHQSDVYFSKNNFLNLSAVNSVWNLFQSIEQNKKNFNKNPYEFYSPEEIKNNLNEIFSCRADSTEKILRRSNPNLVLIILEGWAADVVESMGGERGITPSFDKLASNGLLFTNCYSSGERSEQGIAAILSGFPAQSSTSIISQPSKYPHLACINSNFSKAGYSSSFMFGGQLNYGNIKGYIYFSRFGKIIEGKDFDGSIPRQRLGVPDEFLFERNILELKNVKEPFFSVMYTLSSHSPYDYPMEDTIKTGGEHNKYLNSVFYSDKSLGKYFEMAQEQPWYANTLFVIVADHGHPSPAQRDFFEPAYKKIPLLFFGKVLKNEFKGKTIAKVVSQVDLASTLTSQFDIKNDVFKFSKDFFNPHCPEFAYYTFFTDGFGWIERDNFVVYRNDLKDIYLFKVKDEKEKEEMIKRGKTFLQGVFQDYLDY